SCWKGKCRPIPHLGGAEVASVRQQLPANLCCPSFPSPGRCSVLVLSRKSGEEVIVPDHEITIRVLEIRGNKVRLGITAPGQTNVFRGEVWARLKELRADGQAAAAVASREELSSPVGECQGRS